MVCTKTLAAVYQAIVCRDVTRFLRRMWGLSLKPSCTNYMQVCSIHDHSSEAKLSFGLHPSFPLTHSDHAVPAEPLIQLPSG